MRASGKERKFRMGKGRKGTFNPLSARRTKEQRAPPSARGNERPFQIWNEREREAFCREPSEPPPFFETPSFPSESHRPEAIR